MLTHLLGSSPAVDTSNALYEATEGWAAGVCIMGRSLARSANEGDAEGKLAHGRQAVSEYLATEVLYRLTTEQRRFLLRTSVLDELTSGPCQPSPGTMRAYCCASWRGPCSCSSPSPPIPRRTGITRHCLRCCPRS
ncbi:hypothetical protein E4K10_41210 [Streptomyces sp. T1317-0309]|nr:hypothetical protein E4K10_41210 [Streptomyces sp. T1317-0309]